MPTSFHILIAGGGLGGLALAQALIARGHTVEVFERDNGVGQRQGYYLTVNGDGGEALRRVLPEELYELYLATARRPYEHQASIVRDTDLNLLGMQPSLGRRNVGERRHTGVDRRTLRRILGLGIEACVQWGVSAVDYSEDEEGVTLALSDGRSARGDFLVIANGIRSRLRDKRLPGTEFVPASITGIQLYARTTFTDELLALTPEELHDSMTMVVDGRGNRALVGSFRPRTPIAEAAQSAGVELDPIEPYMMMSVSVPRTMAIPPYAEWTDQTQTDLKAGMQQTVAGWHPAIGALVDAIDTESIFSVAFGYLRPQQEWEPSRVTVLGDAAHGMLPTKGMGANSTLRDASVLADRFEDVAEGRKDYRRAIGEYESDMRAFAYPIIALAADHDNQFGGGAIRHAEHSDGRDGGAAA